MLQTLSKRLGRDKDEDGFTLIELMVVVLIIAILIAIAIPTFLGARERAQDRQAQSNLRNAFAAEKVLYTDNQKYSAVAGSLTSVEPSLKYEPGAVASSGSEPKTVWVSISATGSTVYLSARSKTDTCFFMKDDASSPTSFAKAKVAATAACPAHTAATLVYGDEW